MISESIFAAARPQVCFV